MWNILEKFALKLNLDMDLTKQIVKGVNIYLFNILQFISRNVYNKLITLI